MLSKKAKTYGGSLYDLAAEEGLEDRIKTDLEQLCDAIKENEGYDRLLASPALSKQERKDLLAQVWSGVLHRYTLNFTYILVDNDMTAELAGCLEEYRDRYYEAHNILPVTAVCAAPMGEDAKAKLLAAIESRTGKKPLLTVRIDESLIGGMRLEGNGVSYDGSVSHHLDALRRMLQDSKY